MPKITLVIQIIFLSVILGYGLPGDSMGLPDPSINRSQTQASQTSAIQPSDSVKKLIMQVDQERVLTDLRRLSGVEPICIAGNCYTINGRETGSEGLHWAKAYVIEQLVQLGYSVEIQDWKREGYSDQNLIVSIRGMTAPTEKIYFIAHLDGYLDNNPAADDDASGAVGVLELARILKNHNFNKTIVLFFSTGEEKGALGVRSYVDQLTQEQLNEIEYVITVEMLAYDSNKDGAMQFWSGDQPADFVQLLSGIIDAYHLKLLPQIVTGCA
jgi:Peptidase family M28